MSYIAKVYLNRMFPKKGENCIHIEGDYIVFPFVNVMNPLTNDNPPKNLTESFEIIGDDKPLAGKNVPEEMGKLKAVWNGKEYTQNNYMDIKDKMVPEGDKVVFYIPNTVGWQSGEKHTILIKIHQDRPIAITIERTLA